MMQKLQFETGFYFFFSDMVAISIYMHLLICLSAKPVMSRSVYYVTLLLLSREVMSCCVHYTNYHYCYYMNPAMYSIQYCFT